MLHTDSVSALKRNNFNKADLKSALGALLNSNVQIYICENQTVNMKYFSYFYMIRSERKI